MANATTLQEVFPDLWGPDRPRTLVDLMNADWDTLEETERQLRKLAVDLVHSFERVPVHTPRAALELIEKHHLPVRSGFWIAFALDANRERTYEPRPKGGLRLRSALSKRIPTRETLDEKAALAEGGTYLLVYGGGPSALTEENLESYRLLKKSRPVADVIMWETSDLSATFWSVQAGQGRRGADVVEFPEPDTMRRWQQS